MFDKNQRKLQEAWELIEAQLNAQDQDLDDNGVDDDEQDSHEEDGGGAAGGGAAAGAASGGGASAGTGGDSGSAGADSGSDGTTTSDQVGLYRGGVGGWYGAGKCPKGMTRKNGICTKSNESQSNNIEGMAALSEAYRQVEEGNPCWKGYEKVPGKDDYEDDSCRKKTEEDEEEAVAETKKKKKKSQPNVPGHSGQRRAGNQHMPPPSQKHGKHGSARNRHNRRSDKQKGYDADS